MYIVTIVTVPTVPDRTNQCQSALLFYTRSISGMLQYIVTIVTVPTVPDRANQCQSALVFYTRYCKKWRDLAFIYYVLLFNILNIHISFTVFQALCCVLLYIVVPVALPFMEWPGNIRAMSLQHIPVIITFQKKFKSL